MKRSLQVLFALLLSLILTLSLMTGCVPEDDSSDGDETESKAVEATAEESSAEATAESTPAESKPSKTPATSESKPSEDGDDGEEEPEEPEEPEEQLWTVGFASKEIALPEDPKTPLYIAGYMQGVEITGVHDLQRANAIWLDGAGEDDGIFIISIDCVGLASKYVNEIRTRLASLDVAVAAINVVSTHTHAGLDTFGLWGPLGVDGKNAEFMENLVEAAVEAAKAAYADRSEGTIYYSKVKTTNMLRDSRDPQVMDPYLYQLRFEPKSEDANGIRIVSYGAHAESMRGANTLLSRDYPGEMSDLLMEEKGEDMLYLPGPIGGLVMTKEFSSPFDAVENLEITGRKLTDYLLSIKPENETAIEPTLTFIKEALEVPVENTAFQYYKSLGILDNEITAKSNGSVIVKSEINLISLGGKDGVLFGLVPGEIFPELVTGANLKSTDPTALSKLATEAGYKNLLVINLANDEIGYIVPPSDYIVNPNNPYFERYEVNGEDHYEETNSVGKQCAKKVSEAFASALEKLK